MKADGGKHLLLGRAAQLAKRSPGAAPPRTTFILKLVMNSSPENHLVSAILLWEDGTALWARVTTNASARRLQERLRALPLTSPRARRP